jgi:hypothetical protein
MFIGVEWFLVLAYYINSSWYKISLTPIHDQKIKLQAVFLYDGLIFTKIPAAVSIFDSNSPTNVCDVNGFSFVKTSTKHYENTAKIVGNTILRRLAISLSILRHIPF